MKERVKETPLESAATRVTVKAWDPRGRASVDRLPLLGSVQACALHCRQFVVCLRYIEGFRNFVVSYRPRSASSATGPQVVKMKLRSVFERLYKDFWERMRRYEARVNKMIKERDLEHLRKTQAAPGHGSARPFHA